jgi:hypothetical protein
MKPLVICLASTLVLSNSAIAQEPVDLETTALIKQEGLERSEVLAAYNMFTNIIGPRLTGTPAFKAAADYAVEQLDTWGLENVHLESWEFGRGWTLEGLTLEMREPRYFPIVGYPEAWTPSTKGEIVATPVYVGDKTAEELDWMRPELNGAIVLLTPPQTEFIKEDRLQPAATVESVPLGAPRFLRAQGPVGRRELYSLVQEAGAAVVLQPTQGEHGTMFVLGRRSTQDDAVPSIILASEHYNMIVRLLQAGVSPTLRIDLKSTYHEDDTNGYNVLAEIPGIDPDLRDEVVLIGAHLDSWHSSPGGTDNADGSASTMEAMRILQAIGVRPRRTIRMALWGGEEEGLLGARAWVEQHLAGENNRDAFEKFSVYFNNDPGYGKIYGFHAEDNEAAKAIMDLWLAPLEDTGVLRNVIEGVGSTDHVPFVRIGVPGFNAIQEYSDYDVRTHHTNMDFYERVAEEELQQAAIVLATFAYHAAMRDERIPRGG